MGEEPHTSRYVPYKIKPFSTPTGPAKTRILQGFGEKIKETRIGKWLTKKLKRKTNGIGNSKTKKAGPISTSVKVEDVPTSSVTNTKLLPPPIPIPYSSEKNYNPKPNPNTNIKTRENAFAQLKLLGALGIPEETVISPKKKPQRPPPVNYPAPNYPAPLLVNTERQEKKAELGEIPQLQISTLGEPTTLGPAPPRPANRPSQFTLPLTLTKKNAPPRPQNPPALSPLISPNTNLVIALSNPPLSPNKKKKKTVTYGLKNTILTYNPINTPLSISKTEPPSAPATPTPPTAPPLPNLAQTSTKISPLVINPNTLTYAKGTLKKPSIKTSSNPETSTGVLNEQTLLGKMSQKIKYIPGSGSNENESNTETDSDYGSTTNSPPSSPSSSPILLQPSSNTKTLRRRNTKSKVVKPNAPISQPSQPIFNLEEALLKRFNKIRRPSQNIRNNNNNEESPQKNIEPILPQSSLESSTNNIPINPIRTKAEQELNKLNAYTATLRTRGEYNSSPIGQMHQRANNLRNLLAKSIERTKKLSLKQNNRQREINA